MSNPETGIHRDNATYTYNYRGSYNLEYDDNFTIISEDKPEILKTDNYSSILKIKNIVIILPFENIKEIS